MGNKEFDLKWSFVKNSSEYLFDLQIPNIKNFEFFWHICPLLFCDMVFEKIWNMCYKKIAGYQFMNNVIRASIICTLRSKPFWIHIWIVMCNLNILQSTFFMLTRVIHLVRWTVVDRVYKKKVGWVHYNQHCPRVRTK